MHDSQRFHNRVVVITGGGHGIGKTYAKHFAMEGAAVVIAELDEEAVYTAARELQRANYEAIAIRTDVSDESSLKQMVDKAVEAYGKIDVLINNAAIFARIPVSRASFDQIDPAEWDKVMQVNVKGTWLACRAVVPIMKQIGKGKIVNIASGTAFHGGSGTFIHYVTSKAGILGFTKTLARELGEHNINVNCVAPGNTQTEEHVSEEVMKYRQSRLTGRALKRIQVPEDVVGAVLFLSSEESDFMTGQTLVVDGGTYMH